MLGCLLSKRFKQFNESFSLSKAARMSSKYLKYNLALLRLYSSSHLFCKTHENISKDKS